MRHFLCAHTPYRSYRSISLLPLGDENNWDSIDGKYPLSNACGQQGQSYEDSHCSEEEVHLECSIDANMSIVGVTNAKVISFNLKLPNSICILSIPLIILFFLSHQSGMAHHLLFLADRQMQNIHSLASGILVVNVRDFLFSNINSALSTFI